MANAANNAAPPPSEDTRPAAFATAAFWLVGFVTGGFGGMFVASVHRGRPLVFIIPIALASLLSIVIVAANARKVARHRLARDLAATRRADRGFVAAAGMGLLVGAALAVGLISLAS